RHLLPRPPTTRRRPALRDHAAAAEDPPRRDDRALMPVQLAPHVPRTAPNDGVIDAAKKAIGKALLDTRDAVGEVILTVERDAIVDVCRALRDTPGLEYQTLMCITV